MAEQTEPNAEGEREQPKTDTNPETPTQTRSPEQDQAADPLGFLIRKNHGSLFRKIRRRQPLAAAANSPVVGADGSIVAGVLVPTSLPTSEAANSPEALQAEKTVRDFVANAANNGQVAQIAANPPQLSGGAEIGKGQSPEDIRAKRMAESDAYFKSVQVLSRTREGILAHSAATRQERLKVFKHLKSILPKGNMPESVRIERLKQGLYVPSENEEPKDIS